MINKTKRDLIITQANSEIAFARQYKQKKIARWKLNENLLYMVKSATTDSRANVELGRAMEFVNTYLSKIDNPLTFKFTKRKESQLKRVKRLNALKEADANSGFWDLKDLAGKKQCLIYGRTIFAYHADSIDGYKSYLENVDVYDFLIDPSAGGLDIEKAKYLGRWGVVKDRYELKGNKFYITSEVKKLLEGKGNTEDLSQEEANKQNRRQAVETPTRVENDIDSDKFKFWEWYTTYEGERYYLLMQENGICIRLEPWKEIQPPTKHFALGAYPIWSYAAVPDLTEYWTPAPLDQVREIFMAQNVNINQMLDNAEEYNKPMKAIDTNAIENLAELKYRKGGYIRMKNSDDINKKIQLLRPSAIDTPLKVFEALETIQEKASGLTAGAKGASEEDKVGIYEGNQQNAADRFGLINKSYAFGYKRFAQLYEMGVRQHLSKRVAIDILGPDGIETEEVSKRDIFRKDDDFTVIVEASNAEEQASATDQKNKLTFLANNAVNPVQNPKKAYEMGAKTVGFNEYEIKELLDTDEYGTAEMMSEAARDIEDLLDGKSIRPNRNANIAYKQKFVDYLSDNQEHTTPEQFTLLTTYIEACEPFVIQNMVRLLNQKIMKMQIEQSVMQGAGGGQQKAPAPQGQEIPQEQPLPEEPII